MYINLEFYVMPSMLRNMLLRLSCLPTLQVAHEFNNSIYDKKPDNFKVIVSSHNFHNTPSSEAIGNLVARIQATGADIVKIATTALDITDCARIFQITVHSQVSQFHSVEGISSCPYFHIWICK